MKSGITAEARKNPQDTVEIIDEGYTFSLFITHNEIEQYEQETGWGIEDVVPSWLLTHLFLWCKDTYDHKPQTK